MWGMLIVDMFEWRRWCGLIKFWCCWRNNIWTIIPKKIDVKRNVTVVKILIKKNHANYFTDAQTVRKFERVIISQQLKGTWDKTTDQHVAYETSNITMSTSHFWNKGQYAPKCCLRASGFSIRNTNCTCMTVLSLPENHGLATMVAHYMVHWADLNTATKREVIYEWARVACYLAGEGTAVGKLHYIIPTLTFSADNTLLICRNGLCGRLLGIGRNAWQTAVNEPN